MKKLRFLSAFIVICSIMMTFAQAASPSPKIVFEKDSEAAEEEAELPSSLDPERLLVEYSKGESGQNQDKWYSAIEGFFSINSLFETTASATPAETEAQEAIRSIFVGDTTFVSVRDFVSFHSPNAAFTYNNGKVTISADGYYMEFTEGAIYYYVNGRILPLSAACFEENGCFYVPIRALAVIYSYDVSWSGEAFTATLSQNGQRLLSGEEFYDYNDYILLAKLIRAESGNQPLEGKIAVGNVVMNRVNHGSFPNSISEVIYDRRSGIQFTTAYNGSLKKNPTEECLVAAKLCLEGYSVTDNSLYFFNPKACSASWIKNNRNYVTSIGDHVFYS